MAISCTFVWGETDRQIHQVQVALGLETDTGAIDHYIVTQGAAGCSSNCSVNVAVFEHQPLSHAPAQCSSWGKRRGFTVFLVAPNAYRDKPYINSSPH